eukprot:4826280-Alexandrium_andersonii.AAC.1
MNSSNCRSNCPPGRHRGEALNTSCRGHGPDQPGGRDGIARGLESADMMGVSEFRRRFSGGPWR